MSKKSKPTHVVSIVESYEKDGEKKNKYIDVGSAWLKEKSFISVQLRDNLAISGRFVIRQPRKNDED